MEIKGEKREKILKEAECILNEWGFKMPDSKILVLDFGLGLFEKIGHIEYWIVNREKENYCGKFIFMFAGQTCPEHYHKNKDETFYIVKGKVKMIMNGKEIIMNKGDTLIMPVKTKHSFTAIENSLILEVSQKSVLTDNFFSDTRIKIGGKNGNFW